MKDKMANTAVGKGLSTVLNAPAKAVNGIFKVFGIDMDKGLKALPAAEREKELLARANKSRRSAIEVAFMCAAGFIALFPVYYLENHREGFLNKVDNWLHPKRTKEEKEAAALKPGDEPKETWWNLINARIIALAVVFGFDQTRPQYIRIMRVYRCILSVFLLHFDRFYCAIWLAFRAKIRRPPRYPYVFNSTFALPARLILFIIHQKPMLEIPGIP